MGFSSSCVLLLTLLNSNNDIASSFSTVNTRSASSSSFSNAHTYGRSQDRSTSASSSSLSMVLEPPPKKDLAGVEKLKSISDHLLLPLSEVRIHINTKGISFSQFRTCCVWWMYAAPLHYNSISKAKVKNIYSFPV